MANELILTRSTKKGNVVLPDFKKEQEDTVSIADEPRRLKISVSKKKNKKTGNVFTAVSGYVRLECFNDDGESEGVKIKKLTVHFTKDAFNDAVNVKNADNLKSGYLYCKAKDIQIPASFRISIKKDEDGNEVYDEEGNSVLKYHEIWIKGVIGLEEFVTSQDALDVDGSTDEKIVDVEVNEETGEISDTTDYKQFDYDDSTETEETKI